ncbi:MAG: DUF2812 domain-containing protein [Eubacteriales bacterium]
MMKTKKLGYSNRCLYDLEGIRETLEKMALKGWKCIKFGHFFTHYEKIQPQTLHYNVIFLPSLSSLDGVPTKKLETLIEMCEESGWEYICQWGNAVIFCSSQDNPLPIETDEALKLKSIHKSMKKEFLPAQFVMMVLFPLIAWMQTTNIHTRPEQFYGGFGIFSLLGAIIVTISMALTTVQYFHWFKQSSIAVEQGGSCVRPINIYWLLNSLAASIFVILLVAILNSLDGWMIFAFLIQFLNVGFIFGLFTFLRKQRFSNKLKAVIYWVLSFTFPVLFMTFATFQVMRQVDFGHISQETEIPLEISDIRPDDTANYLKYHRGGGTFLMEWGTFFLDHAESGLVLGYSLYETNYEYISEKVVQSKLFLEDFQLEDGFRWEQIPENDDLTVWRYFLDNRPLEEYLIQSGKNLIHISYDDGLTEAEKVKAVEILLSEIS